MAPFRSYDDSDDDSDDGLITVVSSQIPVPQTEEEYPCQQCPENKRPVFKSHAELVRHKIQAEHQYCKKCDQEFANRDDLEIHILRSNRHITCFVCIKEFRSESGLQFHTQHAHQTSAGGICPQCHEGFNTQAGLLQHIEGNLCPGGLRRSDIYEVIKDHQQQTNEELRHRSINTTRQDTEPPVLAESENPAVELVNSFSHFKILDQRTEAGVRAEGETIEVDMKWWDKERRQFNCPFRTCGRKFKRSETFHQHLNSDAHTAKNFICPGCKKRFKSSSAMLQHVESGRCRIIQMPDYDRVKDGLTVSVDQSKLSQNLMTMSHRNETFDTGGTNQNQFAESQLQQLKHARNEPRRKDEGGDLAHARNSKGKGKAKTKSSPAKASNAINRRNAAENRKPSDGSNSSFGNSSDEEGTVSSVI